MQGIIYNACAAPHGMRRARERHMRNRTPGYSTGCGLLCTSGCFAYEQQGSTHYQLTTNSLSPSMLHFNSSGKASGTTPAGAVKRAAS